MLGLTPDRDNRIEDLHAVPMNRLSQPVAHRDTKAANYKKQVELQLD